MAAARPQPHRPSPGPPLCPEAPCPSPSPRPTSTSSGRTSCGACWIRPPCSGCRPQSPPGWNPKGRRLAPPQSPAQPQQSGSTWRSGQQVRAARAPRPGQVLGTRCPGILARRTVGEGQARTPGHESAGHRGTLRMIWEGSSRSGPSQDTVQVGKPRPGHAGFWLSTANHSAFAPGRHQRPAPSLQGRARVASVRPCDGPGQAPRGLHLTPPLEGKSETREPAPTQPHTALWLQKCDPGPTCPRGEAGAQGVLPS